jgi:hypothetical protein
MTIEITQPETEELINQRLRSADSKMPRTSFCRR